MPARGFGSRKQDILDPRSDCIYCTAGAEPNDKHAFLRGEYMRVSHRERAVDSLSACISGMYVFKKFFFKTLPSTPKVARQALLSPLDESLSGGRDRQSVEVLVGESRRTAAAHCELCH